MKALKICDGLAASKIKVELLHIVIVGFKHITYLHFNFK